MTLQSDDAPNIRPGELCEVQVRYDPIDQKYIVIGSTPGSAFLMAQFRYEMADGEIRMLGINHFLDREIEMARLPADQIGEVENRCRNLANNAALLQTKGQNIPIRTLE
jgi:hypothetical protein